MLCKLIRNHYQGSGKILAEMKQNFDFRLNFSSYSSFGYFSCLLQVILIFSENRDTSCTKYTTQKQKIEDKLLKVLFQ